MSDVLLPPSVLEDEPDRIRTSTLVVAKTGFTEDAEFLTQFSTLKGVKRMDLVSATIRGVPVTAGRSDYAWYTITFNAFRVNTVGSGRNQGAITIPLVGQDTDVSYGSSFIVVQTQVPFDLYSFETTVKKPDGSKVGSSEIDSIVLTFRVYQDLYRGRESQHHHIRG